MNKIIIFIISIFIYGCASVSEDNYFNGSIKIIDNNIGTKKVNLKEISIDQRFCDIYIFDSLMVTNLVNNEYAFNITNINTKQNLGYFCHIGRAGDEILTTAPISSIFEEDGQLKTILADPNKNKLFKWNITKSIDEKLTVFDTIIPFGSTSKYRRPYHHIEYVNDSTLITYIPSFMIDPRQTKPMLPMVELRAIYNDSVYNKFNIFKDTFEDEVPMTSLTNDEFNKITPSDSYYLSRTSIKADNSTIVQAMLYLGQLNFIDVKTNKIKGVRIKGTPDFSLFKNQKKVDTLYFCGGLLSTNDRVFVGYSGEKKKMKGNVRYMYEFDWNGNIINIYDIGADMDEIIYNKIKNVFYCVDFSEEKIYSMNLN